MEVAYTFMQMDHLEQVMSIENACYTTPWSRTAFVQELMNNDLAVYLVALYKGQVVGYCGMWIIIDEAHITTIAVHPEFRRQKIASTLLKASIDLAKFKGAHSATLEVRASNEGAKTLYQKFGFEPAGIRKGYYSDNKEDAIIMWKEDV